MIPPLVAFTNKTELYVREPIVVVFVNGVNGGTKFEVYIPVPLIILTSLM